jgi:hypothetical protein
MVTFHVSYPGEQPKAVGCFLVSSFIASSRFTRDPAPLAFPEPVLWRHCQRPRVVHRYLLGGALSHAHLCLEFSSCTTTVNPESTYTKAPLRSVRPLVTALVSSPGTSHSQVMLLTMQRSIARRLYFHSHSGSLNKWLIAMSRESHNQVRALWCVSWSPQSPSAEDEKVAAENCAPRSWSRDRNETLRSKNQRDSYPTCLLPSSTKTYAVFHESLLQFGRPLLLPFEGAPQERALQS